MLSGESRKKSAFRLNNTLITMGAALCLQICAAQLSFAEDWPVLQHDISHSGYNSADPIKLPFERDTVNIGREAWGGASPVIVNNVAYFGTAGGEVLARRFPGGELIWKINIGAPVYISPAKIGAVAKMGAFLLLLAGAAEAAMRLEERPAAAIPLETLWFFMPALGIGLYAQIFNLSGDPVKPYLVWAALSAPLALFSKRPLAAYLTSGLLCAVLYWGTLSSSNMLALTAGYGKTRWAGHNWLLPRCRRPAPINWPPW